MQACEDIFKNTESIYQCMLYRLIKTYMLSLFLSYNVLTNDLAKMSAYKESFGQLPTIHALVPSHGRFYQQIKIENKDIIHPTVGQYFV